MAVRATAGCHLARSTLIAKIVRGRMLKGERAPLSMKLAEPPSHNDKRKCQT